MKLKGKRKSKNVIDKRKDDPRQPRIRFKYSDPKPTTAEKRTYKRGTIGKKLVKSAEDRARKEKAKARKEKAEANKRVAKRSK